MGTLALSVPATVDGPFVRAPLVQVALPGLRRALLAVAREHCTPAGKPLQAYPTLARGIACGDSWQGELRVRLFHDDYRRGLTRWRESRLRPAGSFEPFMRPQIADWDTCLRLGTRGKPRWSMSYCGQTCTSEERRPLPRQSENQRANTAAACHWIQACTGVRRCPSVARESALARECTA